MSERAGLCHICGGIAKETCKMCGRPACEKHLTEKGVCTSCAGGRRYAGKK
jgi:hypothetical protein